MRLRRFVQILLLAATFALSQHAFAQANAVANPGFESGSVGSVPPGWFAPPLVAAAGYSVQISTTNPKEGNQCAVISLDSRKSDGFGNIMQTIDATPFRGKRVWFRAAVRYTPGSEPGSAALWLRVDRPNDQRGFFDNMSNRPITSQTWSFYQIVGDIDADAVTLNFGMMLIGGGKAWLDAVSLGGSEESDEPVVKARALTDRGLVNLTAFAKLYGYVRHFHPSDAVEQADWNALAMAGVMAAEDASDGADLAHRLDVFFKPIAPSVQIIETDKAPPKLNLLGASNPSPTSIVTWQNIGFGGGTIPANQNIYRAQRVFTSRPSGAIPKGNPDPNEPFETTLGGGVSCRVPVALFASDHEAIPHTATPVPPKGIRAIPTGNDRTTRLADVVIAWNVYEHFYPYFDIAKTDWMAVLSQTLKSAATDQDEHAFLLTLRRLVASAKDGHGFVGHNSDDAYAMPPILTEWVEGKFIVTVVGPGIDSIKPGDEIVRIDGKSVDDCWHEAELTISGATEQWRRYRSQTVMLLGSDGSTLNLQIRRGDGAPTPVSVKRSVSNQLKEKRPKPIEELKVGYWYVDLDGSRLKMPDYQQAVRDLSKAEGIVFDMRGYPGESATDVLTRITGKPITSALWNTPTVTKPDHQDMTFVQSRWPLMDPQVPRFKGKIAFITDGRAISYAETIMGMVEYYKLGTIVGEPTAGTNGNVNPFQVPGGYTLVFTGMKVLKHDGSQHHGVGISPTIPCHRTVAGIAAGKDEMLDKALSVVMKG